MRHLGCMVLALILLLLRTRLFLHCFIKIMAATGTGASITVIRAQQCYKLANSTQCDVMRFWVRRGAVVARISHVFEELKQKSFVLRQCSREYNGDIFFPLARDLLQAPHRRKVARNEPAEILGSSN